MRREDDEFGFLAELSESLGLALSSPPKRISSDAGSMSLSGVFWRGNDPDHVLLHGGGLNAHAWDGVALALKAPALALDLAGHGHSDWFKEATYTPDRIAKAVIRHIDGIAEQRPRMLVGHSLGGLIAIEIATRRPDLVEQVMLVDATPARASADREQAIFSFIGSGADFSDLDELLGYARSHGVGGPEGLLRRALAFNSRVKEDGRIEFRHHFAHLQPEDIGIVWEPEPLWRALARIDAPVTLVRAKGGAIEEASMHRFKEVRPRDQIIEVPGGHNVPQRLPVELAEIIMRCVSP